MPRPVGRGVVEQVQIDHAAVLIQKFSASRYEDWLHRIKQRRILPVRHLRDARGLLVLGRQAGQREEPRLRIVDDLPAEAGQHERNLGRHLAAEQRTIRQRIAARRVPLDRPAAFTRDEALLLQLLAAARRIVQAIIF